MFLLLFPETRLTLHDYMCVAGSASNTTSLSSSPERSTNPSVHFDLGSAGSASAFLKPTGNRPLVKRSRSMAELAAAQLVRQEEVGLDRSDSGDDAVSLP
jgi:hypothetical protein